MFSPSTRCGSDRKPDLCSSLPAWLSIRTSPLNSAITSAGVSPRLLRAAALSHASTDLFGATNILVEVKDIFRIVAPLDFQQPCVVRSIGTSDALALICRHEIYVGARRGVRRGSFKERSCPRDAFIILCCLLPPAMHVDYKPGIARAVGGSGRGELIGYSGHQTEEDLTMGGGEFARVFNYRVQRSITDLSEIMRLPVVPCSGC